LSYRDVTASRETEQIFHELKILKGKLKKTEQKKQEEIIQGIQERRENLDDIAKHIEINPTKITAHILLQGLINCLLYEALKRIKRMRRKKSENAFEHKYLVIKKEKPERFNAIQNFAFDSHLWILGKTDTNISAEECCETLDLPLEKVVEFVDDIKNMELGRIINHITSYKVLA